MGKKVIRTAQPMCSCLHSLDQHALKSKFLCVFGVLRDHFSCFHAGSCHKMASLNPTVFDRSFCHNCLDLCTSFSVNYMDQDVLMMEEVT